MLSRLAGQVNPLQHTLGQALLAKARFDKHSVKYNRDSGITPSWFVTGMCGSRKTRGDLFVKCDTRRNAETEVAAYHVARLSGLVDVAPCTVRRTARWARELAGSARTGMLVALCWSGYKEMHYESPSDVFVRRCRIFDRLIRNSDRHTGNMMTYGGHQVSVDHAISFGASTYSRDGMAVHPDDWHCVQRLRDSPILDLLVPLLGSLETQQFGQRLAALKKDGRRRGRDVRAQA